MEDDYQMTVYEWDEDFYNEIIKDHNFSFGKFNPINYPFQNEQSTNRITPKGY